MSAAPAEEEAREADSQLGTLRRLGLYTRRPADAFSITSSAERRRDALLGFALYFLVRTPVSCSRDRLPSDAWTSSTPPAWRSLLRWAWRSESS